MFRLSFVLLAVIGIAMLVGGRDLSEAERAAEAPVRPAAPPAAPEASPVEVAAAHIRPASVDALLGAPPRAAPALAAPVDRLAAPAAEVAGAGVSGGGVSGGGVSGAVASGERLVAAAPVPRSREFLSVGEEMASLVGVREDVAAALAEATVAYVSGNRVNVRSGPSTEFGVVGQVTFGEATEILSDDENGWVRIRIQGDGIEGYISARFLQNADPNG